MTADLPPVSVVMPLLDEEQTLRDAVTAVLRQGYPGELEVVLAVGPSRDRTQEVADALSQEDPRVRVVANPSGRTPDGLNAAIAAARHDVIVRCDGHAQLSPGYIATAVRTLAETGAANVGGTMHPVGRTPFERAVAVAMSSRLGVGGGRFHTGGVAGPVDTVYLGVFDRRWLERVGTFDRRFTRTQDWELNHRLRRAGGTVWFTPQLRVDYRPRGSVLALAKQYRDYGRWRRVVATTHQGTLNPRYLAPPTALVACAVGAVGGFLWRPLWAIPATYAAAVTVGGVAAGRAEGTEVAVRMPLVLATMHGSWGWGFLTSRPTQLLGAATASEGEAA